MSVPARSLLAAAGLLATTAAAAVPTGALAATSTPRALPTSERTLTAAAPQRRDCVGAPASGRGVVTQTWTATDEGVVKVRLSADEASDWDLALFDVAGRRLDGSAGFASSELAGASVTRGQAVRIQACRRAGADRTAALAIDFTAITLTRPEQKLSLVEVDVTRKADFQRLQDLGLDLTDHSDGDGQEAILHGPEDAQTLTRNGFSFHTKIIDLAAQDAADRASERRFRSTGRAAPTPGGRTSYRTYPDYQADLKKLAEDNPGDVRPITLPVKTIEGREITGVEIAKDVARTDDGRPQYVQIGVHHAREWPGGEATMELGLDLVQRAKAGESRWRAVFEGARTFVIPVMNVDGFITSRTAGPAPNDDLPATPGTPQQIVGGVAYRRKNCRPGPGEAGTPCVLRQQNDNGVDPNRNYGEQWGGPGTSSMQNSLVYHGTGPFSEPETQSVRQFLLKKQPTVLITNHTFTGLILRPPGTGDQGLAPDEDRLRKLGDAMARETDYLSQYSFQLYDTTGTTDDWLYGGLGAFSYTPEIGKTNFHPSYTDDFVPEYDGKPDLDDEGQPTGRKLGGLREAYLLAGETVLNPDSHSVIEGTAPAGRTLRIKRSFVTVTSSKPNDNGVQNPVQRLNEERESTLTVPASGRFVWHTNPSKRPFESEDTPWKLTCEDGNGTVLESLDVFVARAQRVDLTLACGATTPTAAATPGAGGAGQASGCSDTFSPRTAFTRSTSKITRRAITLRGRSIDQGCGSGAALKAAGLQRVRVSIARTASKGRCRFLRADGRFSSVRLCRETSYLTAKGLQAWSFSKRMRLPRGEYKVWVQGLDRARNIERKDARRNFLRIRVR